MCMNYFQNSPWNWNLDKDMKALGLLPLIWVMYCVITLWWGSHVLSIHCCSFLLVHWGDSRKVCKAFLYSDSVDACATARSRLKTAPLEDDTPLSTLLVQRIHACSLWKSHRYVSASGIQWQTVKSRRNVIIFRSPW